MAVPGVLRQLGDRKKRSSPPPLLVKISPTIRSVKTSEASTLFITFATFDAKNYDFYHLPLMKHWFNSKMINPNYLESDALPFDIQLNYFHFIENKIFSLRNVNGTYFSS